jgi:hypothetical protein
LIESPDAIVQEGRLLTEAQVLVLENPKADRETHELLRNIQRGALMIGGGALIGALR